MDKCSNKRNPTVHMPFLGWHHTVPRDLHGRIYADVILQSGAIE